MFSLLANQIYPIFGNEQDSLIEKVVIKNKKSIGFCLVYQKLTIFYPFTENLRESGFCKNCSSTNRQRQMSLIFLSSIGEVFGEKYSSLKEFSIKSNQSQLLSNIMIFNTETNDIVHNYLKNFNGYFSSEHLGDEYKSGEIVQGILHQNLKATSFEDNSVDILMSSDVFEHIPDPYDGFREVYRILKPGGRHLFTVPFYSDRYQDEIRAMLDDNGQLTHLLPAA